MFYVCFERKKTTSKSDLMTQQDKITNTQYEITNNFRWNVNHDNTILSIYVEI